MIIDFKKHDWILGGFEFLHVDNVVANAGTGGATLATDDIAGVHYPRAKVVWGADGVANDASAATPLPVVQTGTHTVDTELPAAAALADATANPTTPIVAAALEVFNGTTWDRARGDTTNGVDVDVTRLPALPAGTNNIGDVDVLTLPALPTGANTIGAVNLAQYTPATGRLPVDGSGVTQPVSAASLPLPTGAATETTLAALNTKTATAKTSDYDTGAGTDTVEMLGIALPGAGGAVQGGTATNPLRTDPTGTTTQPVSAASLPLPTGAATESTLAAVSGKLPATLGQKAMTASMAVVLASDQASVPVAATLTAETTKVIGTVNVAAGQTIATTNAGTFAVQAGQVAHDAAVSGNPVLIAARANANEPAAVSTDGDATHLWADLWGRLVVQIGHPNPEAPVTINATASGDTTVIAAPGVGVSIHVCKGSIHNRGASNILVALTDGAAGTARFKAEIASEGGAVGFSFGSRGWKLTANTLLAVNLGAAGDVDINITEYYLAP